MLLCVDTIIFVIAIAIQYMQKLRNHKDNILLKYINDEILKRPTLFDLINISSGVSSGCIYKRW